MVVVDYILEPLSFAFMQRALIVAVLVGTVCAVLSCFLVLKGWSLMGDALSHAVLPGIALAYAAGLPLALGAFAAGMVCAVFTGFIKEQSRIKEDAAMAIVFSGMFALGLVLLTRIKSDVHLMHVLFGNILGVGINDIIETGTITVLTLLFIYTRRRDLILFCFDSAHARVMGLSVKTLHFTLLSLLALTIVASLKAAGIILVIAMLIAPGAIAFLCTKSFDRMLVIAVCVSLICCIAGTFLSYHLDTAPAPLIVVLQALIFAGVFIRSLLDQKRKSA